SDDGPNNDGPNDGPNNDGPNNDGPNNDGPHDGRGDELGWRHDGGGGRRELGRRGDLRRDGEGGGEERLRLPQRRSAGRIAGAAGPGVAAATPPRLTRLGRC